MNISSEFKGVQLGDKRLNRRIELLAEVFEKNHGQSICFSCQDWKTSKAAYRFFDNDRFDEDDIIEPHLAQTYKRMNCINKDEKILVLHDSSEITFPGNKIIEGGGFMGAYEHNVTGKELSIKGMMMHSSLAATSTGVPLGLVAQKLWTRDIKDRRKIRNLGQNFTRVPVEEKESFKWIEGVNSVVAEFQPERLVHICDRDADMYELFFNSISLNTNFIIRAVHQRATAKGKVKIFDRISKTTPCGEYELHLPKTHKRKARTAKIKVRYYKVKLLPPVAKGQEYPPIELFVISAKERESAVEDRVDWKLLTNMPITNFETALEKINWYKERWNIEVFFKILKSGFGIERSRLRHIDRLKKFVAFTCVMSWKIFWLSKISREAPESERRYSFTREQRSILIKFERGSNRTRLKVSSNSNDFTIAFARLGGYLARNSDPPPGPIVLWRAMMRLNDIQLGASL
ncbi:MAG: IS4 family transposase [Bdellovibrionaceae bacterium]|nr:IS4 family transposase [Pseudobdellovibrionaceae bacterium]